MRTDSPERINIQRERKHLAIDKLSAAGYDCHYESDSEIRFFYNGNEITYFPFKQWFTGKGIKDGRMLDNLLKQIQ